MDLVDVTQLGTVLMIWAHPDDETYLAGALSSALTDAGQRVACITATRGEAGESSLPADGRDALARIRTVELERALAVLGVREHHWLDYPDGGCALAHAEEAASRIATLLLDVRPDTVITFGPDGFTGHPDHQAVSSWTDRALSRTSHRPRLLHAVATEEGEDWELSAQFGVYDLGKPRVCTDDEVDVLLRAEGQLLDRKVEALMCQASQTLGLVQAIGAARFRTWVAVEAFAAPLP